MTGDDERPGDDPRPDDGPGAGDGPRDDAHSDDIAPGGFVPADAEPAEPGDESGTPTESSEASGTPAEPSDTPGTPETPADRPGGSPEPVADGNGAPDGGDERGEVPDPEHAVPTGADDPPSDPDDAGEQGVEWDGADSEAPATDGPGETAAGPADAEAPGPEDADVAAPEPHVADESGAETDDAAEEDAAPADEPRGPPQRRSDGSAAAGSGASRLSRLVPSAIRDRYLAKFVAIVLAVVVVIAAVGAVGYVQASDTVEEDTEEQLQSTAQLQANAIGAWVEETRRTTEVVSRSDQVVGGDVEEIQQYLDLHWRSYDVRGIHYVDAGEGAVAASSDDGTRGTDLSEIEEPWADVDELSAIEGYDDVRVSDTAYRSELLDEEVVAFYSPAFGWDDRYVVVVAGIEEQLDTLHQPLAGQNTTVVDEDGTDVLTVADDRGTRYDPALVGVDGTGFERSDGYADAYADVEGVDWVAVTSVPEERAYAVSRTVVAILGSIVGVSLVALLGAAVVLGRHTVTPLSRLRERVDAMESGDLSVDLSTSRSDEIGQLYHGFATMRDSLRQTITDLEDARSEAEAARREAEEMNRHLETKADEYSAVIEEWAAGDLTRRLEPQSRNEAMSTIARDLNRMVADLERALDFVKEFAGETAAASEEVTANAEEVRSASQQVTESIQEISAGADRQTETLTSVTDELSDLSATTEEIASLTSEVADLAERTATTGQEGSQQAREAIEAMSEIDRASSEAVSEMRRLEREEVAQIDELIDHIGEIAKETNMLALNANIEASRGPTGDDEEGGFGVVAAEIKELSQDAKQAADAIEERLESIRDQTARAATEVEETSDLVGDATDSVERTVTSLDEIAEYATRTNDGIQEISDATGAQANTTEEVVSRVEEVTSISHDTSEEAEAVASAAEEQNAALAETTDSVEGLSRRAAQLSETLDRFDTAVDPDQRDLGALEFGQAE